MNKCNSVENDMNQKGLYFCSLQVGRNAVFHLEGAVKSVRGRCLFTSF
jgi:hypothetical protein